LHKKLLHQSEFGVAHYVELPKSIHTKFSLPFLNIPTSFYKFWKFETISRNYLNKKEKTIKQCMGRIQPASTVQGSAGCHMWPIGRPDGPRPAGLVQPRRRPACHAVARASCLLAVWSPRAAPRSGTLTVGSVVASGW
jgi:hypothetical protein